MPYADSAVQREYQRKWMASRRERYLEDAFCSLCGSGDGPFDFHHVDPAQKDSHRVWSWTKAKLEAELAKCVILCRRCHVGHHQANGPTHCKRGHEFTAENTYVKPSTGNRECLRCKKDRAAGRLAA